MRPKSNRPSTVASGSSSYGENTIRQPWLNILRAAWLVTALAALLVLGLSVPGYLQMGIQGVASDRLAEVPISIVRVINLVSVFPSFLTVLLCLTLAGLLFWRKSEHGMSLLVSFWLLGYGIINAGPAENLHALLPGASDLIFKGLEPLLSGVPSYLLFTLFPNGQFVPRWSRWLVVLAGILGGLGLADYLMAGSLRLEPLVNFGPVILALLISGTQVYRYQRVSSPAERQQTKWVVFGLGLLCFLALLEIYPYQIVLNWPPNTPRPLWMDFLGLLWVVTLPVLPVCLTIAVLRYRLYDIDLLIRKTLIYSMLTGILGAVYFGGIVLTQQIFRTATGETPDIVIVISTLLIAALFSPIRRRVQDTIDRRFYRRKYDAEKTLAKFNQTLRNEVDIEALKAQLVGVVNDTMQPTHVALWLASNDKGRETP
jgi:hypothetical protein